MRVRLPAEHHTHGLVPVGWVHWPAESRRPLRWLLQAHPRGRAGLGPRLGDVARVPLPQALTGPPAANVISGREGFPAGGLFAAIARSPAPPGHSCDLGPPGQVQLPGWYPQPLQPSGRQRRHPTGSGSALPGELVAGVRVVARGADGAPAAAGPGLVAGRRCRAAAEASAGRRPGRGRSPVTAAGPRRAGPRRRAGGGGCSAGWPSSLEVAGGSGAGAGVEAVPWRRASASARIASPSASLRRSFT